MPQISIIIPIYNVESYIHRCIDSILAQTYTDFELILVDDGSLDNSGEICDEFSRTDTRIHVIHQNNTGRAEARNVGIEWVLNNSDSSWISFIDSDDWVHPNCLSFLIKAASKSNADIVFSPIKKVAEYCDTFPNIRFQYYLQSATKVLLSFANKMTEVSVCGKLYRKEMFSSIRFPKGKLWEDLAITYRLFTKATNCAILDINMYYYFLNDNGTVLKSWRPKRMDEFEAYENMLAYFKSKEEYHELFIAYQEPYIRAISYSYYMCINSDMSKSDINYYSKLISKKMRKALHMYKKNTNICFKNDKGVYETAYPKLMNYYWFINNKRKQWKGKK